jgi:hypothetical protein
LLLAGCTSVKQQLDSAKPSDPALAELQKKVRELEAGVETARLKLVAAQARVAEIKGRQQTGGELASLKEQLREIAINRNVTATLIDGLSNQANMFKRIPEDRKTRSDELQYIEILSALAGAEKKHALLHQSHEALATIIRERETRPTGPCLVVTAMPASPAVQWVVSEYGPKGELIGSLTTEHETMLVRLLARTAKDSAAPKELRIVVWDGATAYGPFGAVNAAKEGGYKSVKFSGTIPSKGGVRAGAKDLPRHHLEDFETEKLFNRLLSAIMGC